MSGGGRSSRALLQPNTPPRAPSSPPRPVSIYLPQGEGVMASGETEMSPIHEGAVIAEQEAIKHASKDTWGHDKVR